MLPTRCSSPCRSIIDAVAIYFLNIKTFGRSDGSSAPGAAAYRAGERLRDERTGRIHDHSSRQDVLHKEIVFPGRYSDSLLDWARDRESLWNAAELAETRKNARVAREYLVALPFELSHEQRIDLVRGFTQELADRYRFAVDVAIHSPRDFPGSDPRNFHAHLLATTREVNTEGLGHKTTLEMGDAARRERGLEPAIHELLFARRRWAEVTNESLRAAEATARIDHRTLEAQGVDRGPRLWIPRVPYEMERRGYRSDVAEELRRQHGRDIEPARERSSEPAPPARDSAPPPPRPAARSIEEVQREAREQWLRLRQQPQIERQRADRSIDDDFTR